MLYVSLIVESLRARPRLMFWAAALAQALLWLLVPWLFYAAPPGDLPITLAVGHEYRLGTDLGPPLAFWLGDAAFRLGGMSGVYLLSQLCVVAAFWALFELGRATVGIFQAVLAVLLMVGIAVLSVPTPEFGPAILAMPIWCLILLHYWRAVGEGRGGYWMLLAVEIGLLLLTSYLGFIFIALVALYTVAMPRGRATLRTADPWICFAVALLIAVPYLLWVANSENIWTPMLMRLRGVDLESGAVEWLRILAGLTLAHAGIVVLAVVASGFGMSRREKAATVDRPPVDPFARVLIYFFALMPAVAVTLAVVLLGQTWSVASAAPLVVCSGLAVIVAVGDSIRLARQRFLSFAWIGLLVGPPVLMATALLTLPWLLAVDLKMNQPAQQMGRFFADNFQRRTGRALAIVAGDPETAALVALQAPTRPSLLMDEPARSPWVGLADVQEKGAVVVWPATDRPGTPPASIKALFPDLVLEVPRVFERRIEGRLPLLRIGWAVIRPQAEAPSAPASP
jgi:4-amino-4-deoxy-L-arabinose transferase-like glycosyltransferase